MIVKRTHDIELIESVMLRDDIFAVIAEDGQTKQDQDFDTYKNCFLSLAVDGQLIGIYVIHPQNQITIEIHAHVLPEYRKQHSKESGRKALDWIINNVPQCEKVIAKVPSIYENVYLFCLANGFTEEGVNRLSYKKDGKIYDQYMLGITKQEIESFLRGK